MTRVARVVLLGTLAAAGGCTSVRMVQRDGCWVRQTEKKPFGGVHEEVGPCVSPETPWVEGDRLTRLVQECAVRADRRWQSRALAAWSRGETIPERGDGDDVLQACMNESARAVMADREALRQENETLKRQLAALGAERDALRTREDGERKEFVATTNRLADHLGEAAKKAQQPGVATATARSEQSSSSTQAPSQPATVAVVQPQPATVAVVQSPAVAPVVVGCPPQSAGRAGSRQARSTAAARRPPVAKERPDCEPASPVAAPAAAPTTPTSATPMPPAAAPTTTSATPMPPAAAVPASAPAPSPAPSAPGPSAPAASP